VGITKDVAEMWLAYYYLHRLQLQLVMNRMHLEDIRTEKKKVFKPNLSLSGGAGFMYACYPPTKANRLRHSLCFLSITGMFFFVWCTKPKNTR
jgi:hypothetical protein